ncbi:MAG: peptide chain release factor 3 [Kiloniellales bacterium]
MKTSAGKPAADDHPAFRRRTFAIISHPDAGKTTLTEKLLLTGGAIHLAGEVKARGERRRARSDWMAIEQQRGISVTTSVMTFEYGGLTFNLLDTPGHEDFSEDTYRTLTAVDSAVMVIDAAKGIEAQTHKLLEVCRLRDIPIITFINKIDREGRDPFELIDEIADTLALDTVPMAWPVGMGGQFHGCYDLAGNRLLPYGGTAKGSGEPVACSGPDDPKLVELLGEEQAARLAEEAGLVREACPAFDAEAYLHGHMTPVYFGSALRNFGVRELIEGLAAFAPPPRPQAADPREIAPDEEKVTGFVFKVQANMDRNHRDRIAFMRLCSGRFKRGMKLRQVASGKSVGIHAPIFFFAQDRELAEEAWAGDIIGVPNHGTLRVGDTLSESEDIRFTGIPNFAPEILRRVRLDDPMKAKHLKRGLEDLAEEGVTQVFRPVTGSDWIVGVVGQLQLDVLGTRLTGEYGVKMGFEAAPFATARWIAAADPAVLKAFIEKHRGSIAEDRDGAPVFLARNAWDLNRTAQDHPSIRFSATRERH